MSAILVFSAASIAPAFIAEWAAGRNPMEIKAMFAREIIGQHATMA